ncbi:hypothetical protein AB0I49_33660 [Streptomyces sp. NPDC050617]|uniref:hypothetical protein n=1 Tax=Streptomyces sp. NPDC050617 TaxID=3154628 RepID=UPI00341AC353
MKLKFRKWSLLYFPAGVTINTQDAVANYNTADDVSLVDHPRLRRFLVRFMPSWPLTCFYLHWSNGIDLTKVDERVAVGTATYEDFADAVTGEAHEIMCMECRETMRVVTAAPELPLFTLEEKKEKRPTYQPNCPNCGNKWSARVLEFIE